VERVLEIILNHNELNYSKLLVLPKKVGKSETNISFRFLSAGNAELHNQDDRDELRFFLGFEMEPLAKYQIILRILFLNPS
jgi:hypothetical protein